ncbi:MAG: family 5 extracellular solute-binding protein peptide/nickel transport system substrate-binding [Candidatus Adlerbacteria bacterium]|nr:family 5 extracellular solute-binding protein peptide/nickel transport system substrate-binding [Candidatus Adlerbacteria bacterium]
MSKLHLPSLRLPFLRKAHETYDSFTASGRALFLFFAALCALSSLSLVYMLNASLLVAAPARGGSLTEGLIGSPRFINPILALSDADRDLTALTYSGLLRANSDGTYQPDLASAYTVSDDGLTYTFTIRPEATFHDGRAVTAADIVFTVQKAQAAALKSPLRANWDGVLAEAVDPATVRFTLKAAYAPFIKNLTLGILPEHLWGSISEEEFPFSELNAEPVGSGPYRVEQVSRTASGIPSSYELVPFKNYMLGQPYLSLTLRFYQSEDALVQALQGGEVDAASGLSPDKLAGLKADISTASLNRVFGVFFNQNQSELLRQKAVREALDAAIDRQDLVEKVLGGYGTPLTGPVPPSIMGALKSEPASSTLAAQDRLAKAQKILSDNGWELNESGVQVKTTGTGKNATSQTLAFDLSTANVPELRAAAEYLRETWGRLGVQVTVKVFEAGDLSQNVIRPRKYDALLFGEVIGRELDLFAFWHSSQRNDPGLNVAGYANSTADDALESLRQTTDQAERAKLYQEFSDELAADIPAVFLYAPDFVYSIPKDIQGLNLGLVESPSDRFLSVTQWHREVDYVWPVFLGGNR